jgi:hypothetical protein
MSLDVGGRARTHGRAMLTAPPSSPLPPQAPHSAFRRVPRSWRHRGVHGRVVSERVVAEDQRQPVGGSSVQRACAAESAKPPCPLTYLRLPDFAGGSLLASRVAAGTFWHHTRGPLEPRHRGRGARDPQHCGLDPLPRGHSHHRGHAARAQGGEVGPHAKGGLREAGATRKQLVCARRESISLRPQRYSLSVSSFIPQVVSACRLRAADQAWGQCFVGLVQLAVAGSSNGVPLVRTKLLARSLHLLLRRA